jgi:hypothetical protein
MIVPVELGLDPSAVIPPSTETEHKSTEPTIAHAAQLASAILSKYPLAKTLIRQTTPYSICQIKSSVIF